MVGERVSTGMNKKQRAILDTTLANQSAGFSFHPTDEARQIRLPSGWIGRAAETDSPRSSSHKPEEPEVRVLDGASR